MSCPTCSHTMQGLGGSPGHGWFWCPRCGTIKDNPTVLAPETVEQPTLVKRCRMFEPELVQGLSNNAERWFVIGIAEAINLPEERYIYARTYTEEEQGG